MAAIPSAEEIFQLIDDTAEARSDRSVMGEPDPIGDLVLALFAPVLAEKEREIERLKRIERNAWSEIELQKARALAAEAKLAQAVEALEPFAKMAAAYDGLLEEEDVPVLAQNKLRITLNDLRRARSASARGEKT